jgi:ABC-type protease/lipase transport system fused ATPase/permease subunit
MLNLLLLLVPALYTVQAFDRAFASRSVETLVMLSMLVGLALTMGHAMDVLRSRALAAASDLLVRTLWAPAFSSALARAAGPLRQADVDSFRDIARLRPSPTASGVLALFDRRPPGVAQGLSCTARLRRRRYRTRSRRA